MSIYVAGLTGQTGSGKSTVADIFRAHGVCVIDCDKLAREIVEPGSPVLIDLARLFGDDLISRTALSTVTSSPGVRLQVKKRQICSTP